MKNRPDNSELAKPFPDSNNLNDDFSVTVLQNIIKQESQEDIVKTNGFVN